MPPLPEPDSWFVFFYEMSSKTGLDPVAMSLQQLLGFAKAARQQSAAMAVHDGNHAAVAAAIAAGDQSPVADDQMARELIAMAKDENGCE